jgi:hypothetical protein
MEIPVVLIIAAALGLGCLALGVGIFLMPVDTSGILHRGDVMIRLNLGVKDRINKGRKHVTTSSTRRDD